MRVAGYAHWTGVRPASAELARLNADVSPSSAALPNAFVGLTASCPAVLGHFGHVSLAADARVDNLEELRGSVGADIEEPTERVLARAYLKWGIRFPERILGDFAIVVWDELERRLVACRDPFGVRPISFRAETGSVWVASDPVQLVRTFALRPEIDERMVVEYLLWRYRTEDRTFFHGVRHLPGGFVLLATDSGYRIDRYWAPNLEDRAGARVSRTEYFEEMRRLFVKSVERRLRSSRPVMIHVSGGLDSSSIAMAADQILRRGAAQTPLLIGAAAVFPGLACDESPFIDMVAQQVGFSIRRWNGALFEPSDFLRSTSADPDAGPLMTSGSGGDITLANETNTGVVLSGIGGDELMTFDGFIRDLLSERRWVDGLRATLLVDGATLGMRVRRLRRVAGQFLPRSIRDLRARRLAEAPNWLAPDLRSLARQSAAEDRIEVAFPRELQRKMWARLHNGYLRRALGLMQWEAQSHGLEYRFPFLDRELVTFILGIPGSFLPDKVVHGRIHREAFRPMLPRAIVERYSKADFTPALVRRVRASAGVIDNLFSSPVWASGRYVNRAAAATFWRSVTGTEGKVRAADWWRIQGVARLETWLRRVLEYHPAV